ncbi:MAG TPA: hypothetical protein VMR81_00590 [Patescibacteria group bacterium]|jgi:hypothetical protein|nr:hypothetical protein [Patescibacteria group bacterium]
MNPDIAIMEFRPGPGGEEDLTGYLTSGFLFASLGTINATWAN